MTLTSVTSGKVRRSFLLLLPFLTDGPVPVAGPLLQNHKVPHHYLPVKYNNLISKLRDDIYVARYNQIDTSKYVLNTSKRYEANEAMEYKLIHGERKEYYESARCMYMFVHFVHFVYRTGQNKLLKNMSKLRATTSRRRRGSRSSEETDRALDSGVPLRPTWAI
ncbi:hypothetical protein EAG_15721 [Camponotus floridanus]|uniref:Uncharacterized protein n=1 Tax=Camponotus floridanus TaxID=104421 RepID=E2AXB2_CAMFO|nr:hypothetical protein EAG_15721 [Camponotus floridanus]